jgi:hypothetical protein
MAQSNSGANFGKFKYVSLVGNGGGSIPWPHNNADWWDYQGIGPQFDLNGDFTGALLNAWGGDARGGPNINGIFTSLLK